MEMMEQEETRESSHDPQPAEDDIRTDAMTWLHWISDWSNSLMKIVVKILTELFIQPKIIYSNLSEIHFQTWFIKLNHWYIKI
jgi:hypothetical protein